MMGFPCGSAVKNLPSSSGDMGSSPGLGRSLENDVATPSSVLAWEIPRTEELAGYSPRGHRVGHDIATKQQQ